MGRRIYGRVYELNLRDPRADEEHPYVGMTTQTLHQRVHGSAGHTSRESVAKDPWKARILRGPAGYRLVETVYDSGDPVENDRLLRRAEAYWIDRLKTTYNDVRPIRPFADPQRDEWRKVAAARKAPTAAELRRAEAERAKRRRAIQLLILVALFTGLAAYVLTRAEGISPAAVWATSPSLGVVLGTAAHLKIRQIARKALR